MRAGGNKGKVDTSTGIVRPKAKLQEWTLKSGMKAAFVEETLSFDDLKNKTFVRFETNGRDQELLTADALARLSSLDRQQYLPAIGVKQKDGKIEILDGSSRRAYVLLKEGQIKSFRVMVTTADISVADAKALAKEIQTAREHCLYEIGQQALPMKEQGMKQADIAEALGCSQSRVSKALKTTSVDKAIYKCFADINELAASDYDALVKMAAELDQRNDKEAIIEGLETGDVATVIGQLKAAVTAPKPKAEKAVVEHLASFANTNKSARRRTKGRNLSFEFSYLTKAEAAELNKIIESAVAQFEGQKP
ncbi:ParB/RepB/Spo0J family partition protein [Photobacterium sp. ZSDE20]|uniref:ParB/RepB/Spo0J family partition protein n=1 Tax=Photobacterium pectinilyticum TaxID=2906793 RepID=A0ABT1N0V1_9GAMM|nr:ParB/RepB/Spo0J family partition protein [Photobacterium sp. ZSDE20]MCQ1058357.1 ParB/RepB/Spo0J family partition protein [Photobacterium sp. ZSDE20]MDD1827866.1 ParB/RepB/Spo0J family partition protein [Photobacterium sp. ZSDE20]